MIANTNEPLATDNKAALIPPAVAKLMSGHDASFAETALKMGGKSDEEVRRTGAMDLADEQVESLFERQHRTESSPIHRAVWDSSVPMDLFSPRKNITKDRAALNVRATDALNSTSGTEATSGDEVFQKSLAVVEHHLMRGTLLDERGKFREEVLRNLGHSGYWGLLVDKAYGGSGVSFTEFARFLTRMAQLDPTIAGMASVHGCIGAVDPLQTFGNLEQKQRFLPRLAGGERLSAFALTEPCAGSDMTALRTVAVRRGDMFYVSGEKLFITNVAPGRTIGLVCLIEGKPAVLIVDLPDEESDEFHLSRMACTPCGMRSTGESSSETSRSPLRICSIPATGMD